ncbi:MAG: hypothetical protein A3J38_04930 [Gammaproteobacteria bacterium RIFCSPHIGHO2_12_FULL_45_9]|nr:MAG: hypothetical protein A3J38_04930 [Gammaproteobacteria bacterium RIFCSPHIGHO2_12_FULL_45_9]
MTAARSLTRTNDEVNVAIEQLDDASTPLLPKAPQQRWYRQLAGGIFSHAVKPIYQGLRHAVTHPISTITSTLTAIPTAIYAFLDATNTRPVDVNALWWASMAPGKKLFSILNASSSLLVNAIINSDFLTATWKGLKEGFSMCCKGAKHFAGNLGLVALGLVGAVTMAALAYGAFLWLPAGAVTAGIPALLSFLIDFAIGYVTIKNLVNKIRDWRNPDIKLQKEVVGKLKCIKAEYLQEINGFLQQKNIRATLVELQTGNLENSRETQLKADLASALQSLFEQKLKDLAELGDEITRKKTRGECAKEWAATIFDITLATTLFLPALATYTEVGYRGVALIENFTGSSVLEQSARAAKIAIGALPALITAIFFPLIAVDFRKTMLQLVTHLYHHPAEIPGALLLLAINGLSTGGMKSVAQGIADNPGKIIFLPSSDSPLSQIYIALNAAGAGVINTTLTVDPLYLASPDPAPSELDSLIGYWDNPAKRPIPHATAEKLQACGLFPAARLRPAQVHGYTDIPDGITPQPHYATV